MINPLISVIVPVYNTEEYLKRCLDSIINQSYKNLEILCIDDGSTDNSGKICDEYALKDNRIKVIHKENGGLASARNAGLKTASGRYINTVDSDDWIEPHTYQYVMDIMIRYNPDLIKWAYYNVNKKGKKLPVPIVSYSGLLEGQAVNEFIYDIIYGKNGTNSVWDTLFKKEIIKNNKLNIPEQITQGEDLYLLVSYLLHCKSVYLLSDKHFYNYFQNSSSLTKKYTSKYINEILILIDEMSTLVKGNAPLEEALSMRVPILIFYTMRLIAKSEMSLARKLQKIQTTALRKGFTKRLNNVRFTDYVSIKTFPVFLAYKGFFKLALLSIIFMDKMHAVYKKIKIM
jgi:glycosyltransferase involved in cell wall biosynthesis